MKATPHAQYLWGKKDDKLWGWLPLTVHLLDTKNVGSYLYNHWVSDHVKQVIAENSTLCSKNVSIQAENLDQLSPFEKMLRLHTQETKQEESTADTEDIKKLFLLLCAIHDIGKAMPVFTDRSSPDSLNQDMQAFYSSRDIISRSVRLSVENHRKGRMSHATNGALLLQKKKEMNTGVGAVIGAHHGMPMMTEDVVDDRLDVFSKLFFGEENQSFWREAQQEVIDQALEQSGFASFDEIPQPNMVAQMLLTGLVIVADWIASNEKYFPYIEWDSTRIGMLPDLDEQARVQYGLEALNLPESWQPDSRYLYANLYKDRFDFGDSTPYPVQELALDIAKQVSDPGLVILEAAMGQGKTEAALAMAEIFAHKAKANGIFFALPTQATSDGIFSRVADWVKHLEEDTPLSIRLVHGKAEYNEDYTRLFDTDGNEEPDIYDEQGNLLVHEWFNGSKKSLLDEFVVGTVDQLLMMALKRKHVMLRHLGLANKVVIIDEVHAYDAYMDAYLERTLEWLGAYHVPVIMLSATLPQTVRDRLKSAYYRGRWEENLTIETNNGTLDYPLITYTDGNQLHEETTTTAEQTKTVEVEHIDSTQLINQLKMYRETGGCIAVICNTVRRAQEVAHQLAEEFMDNEWLLFHSRFDATRKMAIQQQLLDQLSTHSKRRPHFLIVVATQVIEQSLDLDFDYMMTELCPMDLLLQRVGRLHRKYRHDRPDPFQQPRLALLEEEGKPYSSGSQAVYGNYLLERTKQYLPKQLKLPQAIPELVQTVYQEPVKDDLFADIGGYYEEYCKNQKTKEYRAKVFQLRTPDFTSDSTINDLLAMAPGYDEKEAEASVRDGLDAIEVILAYKDKGNNLKFMNDRQWQSISAGDDLLSPVAKALSKHKIYLPNVLSRKNKITQTIKELEKVNGENYGYLQKSRWLSGELILPLDNKGEAIVNQIHIYYNEKYGMSWKEEKNDNVKI